MDQITEFEYDGRDDKGRWVKCYIEPNFNSLTNYRRNRKDWNNLFFYKEGKKTKANVGIIKNRSVSSVIKFNDNCFYKMQNASLKDPIFDYYRIKKENLDEDVRNYARKITPRKIKYRLRKDIEFKYETKKTELIFD